VGITFSRISSSYWIDNLGFLLMEKLAAIFITPCSWGFQLAGHLLHQLHANKFSGTIHHRAISAHQLIKYINATHKQALATKGFNITKD
jgi:hypothetical protein